MNPDDDTQWEFPWCASCPTSDTRAFATGTHRLFLEARDTAGVVTAIQIEFVIVPLPVEGATWTAVKHLFD